MCIRDSNNTLRGTTQHEHEDKDYDEDKDNDKDEDEDEDEDEHEHEKKKNQEEQVEENTKPPDESLRCSENTDKIWGGSGNRNWGHHFRPADSWGLRGLFPEPPQHTTI